MAYGMATVPFHLMCLKFGSKADAFEVVAGMRHRIDFERVLHSHVQLNECVRCY